MGAIALCRVTGRFGTARGRADGLGHCRKDSHSSHAYSHPDSATDSATERCADRSTTADLVGSPQESFANSSTAAALTVITPNSTPDIAGPPIDWSKEAHDVAAKIARSAPALEEVRPPILSNSPFVAPPAHHRGEQIPTADGRSMAFVSDNCYQLSKDLTHITNATNTGVAIQTNCNRRSKEPRGDLFNQLPAYKKNHPAIEIARLEIGLIGLANIVGAESRRD